MLHEETLSPGKHTRLRRCSSDESACHSNIRPRVPQQKSHVLGRKDRWVPGPPRAVGLAERMHARHSETLSPTENKVVSNRKTMFSVKPQATLCEHTCTTNGCM